VGASFTFTVTKLFTGGLQHTAYAFTDIGCVAAESNEDNNRYGPITIALTSGVRPDLAVESVLAQPLDPVAGQTVVLVVRVANQGTQAVNAGALVGIYTDATPTCGVSAFSEITLPALAIGARTTFTTAVAFPTGGEHRATVFADNNCTLTERDEANNLFGPIVFNAPPAARPDLVVAGLTANPAQTLVNQPVTYTVRISNTGAAATASAAAVAIYSGATPSGCGDLDWDNTGQAPPLSAGGWADVVIPTNGYPYENDWPVYAFVDYTCSITETNGANNVGGPLTVPVTVPLPDLVIESAVADPTRVAEGRGVTLTIHVANRGIAAASGTSRVGVYVDQAIGYCNDPQPIGGWITVSALAAGASEEVIAHVPASAFDLMWDSHDITLYENYDCGGRNESSFDNNRYGPISIGTLWLDLTIESLAAGPTSPPAREPVTYTVRVRNRGTAAMTTAVSLTIYSTHVPWLCGDTYWDSATTVPPLATGAYADLTLRAAGFDPPGQYTVYALADPACLLWNKDSDPNNNRYGPLTVWAGPPLLPDLVVDSVTSYPTNPAAGEAVHYVVRVRNAGTAASPVAQVGIYRNRTPGVCGSPDLADHVAPLAIGTSQDVVFNDALAQGWWYIYAAVDDACAIEETDEYNNSRGPIEIQVGAGLSTPTPTPTPTPGPTPAPTRLFAFVADGTSGLRVLNVTDPAAAQLVSTLDTPGEANDVVVIENGRGGSSSNIGFGSEGGFETRPYYALVADGSAGLQVINVSDPVNPMLVGTYNTPGDARSVAVGQVANLPYAFVADGSWGLRVVDISTPTNPTDPKTGGSFYDTSGSAYGVAISGTIAFIADGAPGLVVINVADPANPQFVQTYDTPGEARSVAVAPAPPTAPGRTWAYVADGSWGLHVIDVTDPANPQFVSVTKTPGTATDVTVAGFLAYLAANDKGLRLVNPAIITASATACDTAGNCATAQANPGASAAGALGPVSGRAPLPMRAGEVGAVPDWPRALALAAQAESLLVAFTGPPAVLDSAATVKVSGEAHALVSSLQTLIVTADGVTLLNWSWLPGVVTDTLFTADWTPTGDGPHALVATATDQDGATTDATYTVIVDSQPPAVAVAPTILTGDRYHEPRTLDLTGTVTDTGGVASVEWQIANGKWQMATLDSGAPGATSDTWRAAWTLGAGALPDGATFDVTVRATDLGGHVTEATQVVTVDVRPPAAVALNMTSGGNPVAPGDAADAAAGFDLTWTAASDGSGLGDYQVRWTAQITEPLTFEVSETSKVSDPRASSYTAAEGQKIMAYLTSQDVYGQQRTQSFGPVYADGPLTPDYVWMDVGPIGNRPYMTSGCSLLGVDRRVARYARGGAALSAEQELLGSWNGEALRLTWTGADWNSDGDLFIYLDTAPGGATQAYNPYPATADTHISLPDGMGADYLVWVRDAADARLLHWNGSDWDLVTALDETQYRFDGATNDGQTDLYLPFDLIGLAAGGSLDLLALASEQDGLRLWATLPNANPVNSPRVIANNAYVTGQQFSLSQRYHWDALAAGICPNGSQGGAATARFADVDLQVRIAADPAGATYNLIQDNLFWLQQLLLGAPPADVAAQLAFLAAGQPPVGPGQTINYTLTFRNRGTATATGVFAEVTPKYALRLLSASPVSLGDLAPGAAGSVTFQAQVDTTASPAAWAAVAVEIHDAAHPAGGPPLEWLWAHHRVDRSAPQFFGIQQPGYVVGPGATTVIGYAYDEAGVPLVSLEVQGVGTVNCPVTAPQGGQWTCAWPVTGADNETLQVKLHARDGFGQEATWPNPLPFLVDTAAPTVALDLAATQVVSGSVVTSSAFPVYGDVADAGGVAKVEVCTSQEGASVTLSGSAGQLQSQRESSEGSVCGQATLQLAAGHTAVTYDDAPAGPLPIGGSCVARTFTVAESFSIGQVTLGFAAEHPRRDELQVELASPAGTTVRALYDDGTASVHFANYDVSLRDAAPTALAASKGDHDPAAPYFDRGLRPYAALQAFQGQNSQGTWTLTICDRNPAANTGVYLRSRLTLSPRDPAAKIGRWTFSQAADAGQLDYVARSLTVYAEDIVGNRTADPLRLNVWVDNVSPAITVTAALATAVQGRLTTVLTGTVSDGSPATDVSLHIQTPDGSAMVRAAAREDGRWWYDLQGETAGRYTLWAVATDQAGNSTTVGPFAVDVTCTDAGLAAMFVSAEPSAGSPLSVTLTAVVSNTGTATVAAGLPVAFSVDEKPIGTALTAQALGPGQSVTVALDWAVEFPGDYTINVVPNSGTVQPLALCRQPAAAHQALTIADAPLYLSWNLVSAAVNPFVPAISTVQRSIAGRYFVIQSFASGAKSYYPTLPPEFNTLTTWDAAHGYWIKAVSSGQATAAGLAVDETPAATLRLVGARFAEDRPLPLAAGWNLVSYLPQTSLPVTVALESIAGQYTVVQGFDHGAQSFYPDLDPLFNTLQVMQPGLGYWIRATQAVTLTYPSSAISMTVSAAGLRLLSVAQSRMSPRALIVGQDARMASIRQTERAAGVTPTSAWADFSGPALTADAAALPVGTLVKAVDPQGTVCGATTVTTEGRYGLLACYGDDPDTPADEGAAPGETIRLVVAGQTVGTGTWLAQGEHQWTPLGKVNLWRLFLPRVEQGGGQAESAQPTPKSAPPARQWLPFVGGAGARPENSSSGSQPAGTPSPAPEPALTPAPTRGVQQPARRRKSAGG
ncbi:MAG: proprotein convertase P-domain-containing protein, partial [Chloroflexi bacterium]|nr:proprotein convertase P-domain-containing protein [Chloroflexota bacterium]